MTENRALSAEAFVEKSLHRFLDHIRTKVFLMIQNDHKLMQEYLDLIRVQDGVRLNALIGELINETFRLDDAMETRHAGEGSPQGALTDATSPQQR